MKSRLFSFILLISLIIQSILAFPFTAQMTSVQLWSDTQLCRVSGMLTPLGNLDSPWQLKITFPDNGESIWIEDTNAHVYGAFEFVRQGAGYAILKPKTYAQTLVSGRPLLFEYSANNLNGDSEATIRGKTNFEIILV